MAAAETKHSKPISTTTVIKLLITSSDCDPKAELTLPAPIISWNDVVDALHRAKYCFAMRRLPPPQKTAASAIRNPNPQTKAAFLGLYGARKVGFFYGGDYAGTRLYEITYDERLMDGLPSHVRMKGMPRFHLFSSLPVDMQWAVAEHCESGREFASMRCVNRQLSLMKWNNPLLKMVDKYARPPDTSGGGGSGGGNIKKSRVDESKCSGGYGFLLRVASAVFLAVALYCFSNEVRYGGEHVHNDEDDDDDEFGY